LLAKLRRNDDKDAGLLLAENEQLRQDLQWILAEAGEPDIWTNDVGWERIDKIRARLKA